MEAEQEVRDVTQEPPAKRACHGKHGEEAQEVDIVLGTPRLTVEGACEWAESLHPAIIGLLVEDLAQQPLDVRQRMSAPVYIAFIRSLLKRGLEHAGKDILRDILPKLTSCLPFPEEVWDECRYTSTMAGGRMKEIMLWIFVTTLTPAADGAVDASCMNAGLVFCMQEYDMSEFQRWMEKAPGPEVDAPRLYAAAIALGEFEYFDDLLERGLVPDVGHHQAVLEKIDSYTLLDPVDFYQRFGDMELIEEFKAAAVVPCTLANLKACDPELVVKHASSILDSRWVENDEVLAYLISLVQRHAGIRVPRAMQKKWMKWFIRTWRVLGYEKVHGPIDA